VKTLDGFTHKYHAQPRLSATQISEYLSANATKRGSILKDAKYPPTFMLIRYEDAKNALIAHLADGNPSSEALDRKLIVLKRKAQEGGITDYAKKNCGLCIDAIESFQANEAEIDVGRIKFLKPQINYSRLKIAGVNVSVSVDLRTEKIDSKGVKSTGGTTLVFSKPGAKGQDKNLPDRCKAITLLVFETLKATAKASETLDPTLCMAIDVFSGVVYRAKGEQKNLYRTVKNSCGEVAAIWPSVEPPVNYFGPPIPKT
jgi:hypothetical protein